MKVRVGFRKSVALLTGLALFLGGAPAVFADASTAAITGVILDPSGHPASGFKVVLQDTASGKDFMSEPTDAQGNYSTNVPVGGRYKVQEVIAADGVTKLPVQDVPPVSVLTAGTTHLNVRFHAAEGAGATPATASNDEKNKKKGAVPWYKKPGPIVGIVLGAGAVLALALGGGSSSSSSNASPSAP